MAKFQPISTYQAGLVSALPPGSLIRLSLKTGLRVDALRVSLEGVSNLTPVGGVILEDRQAASVSRGQLVLTAESEIANLKEAHLGVAGDALVEVDFEADPIKDFRVGERPGVLVALPDGRWGISVKHGGGQLIGLLDVVTWNLDVGVDAWPKPVFATKAWRLRWPVADGESLTAGTP